MNYESMTDRELDARKCFQCGRKRPAKNARYCSQECYRAACWAFVACQSCGKEFEARAAYLRRGQMKYCSERCAQVASRKNQGVHYDGDRYVVNAHGYYTDSRGRGRLLHRVKWEKHHGPIPAGFVVHHKDGDKLNNDISNLGIMEWGEHTSQHNIERAALRTLDA